VGTVELELDDMPKHRPHLTPWMASLLVKDEYRRQGVAGHLIKCLHRIVHQQGEGRCAWGADTAHEQLLLLRD